MVDSVVFDRASARHFVDRHLVTAAAEFDRQAAVPESFLDLLSEAGLWAPFLPPRAGGQGVDWTEFGRIHAEIGRGCSSVRSLLTVHGMVTWAVQRWGTGQQRERWLPGLARGHTLAAFCLTEPEAGSDTARIATTARPAGRGWVLDGVKTWITGGRSAMLFLVFARLAEGGSAAFLVPRECPGVDVTPMDDALGTRASLLATVTLRDVEVADDALLTTTGFGAEVLLTGTLDLGRYSVAAGCVGILQACLDASAEYAGRRHVGGAPLRDHPLTKAKLADMVTDLAAARLLCERAGRLKDAGDAGTVMATWVAKYFAARAAARHASQAVQIHGAHGCGPDHQVGRYYRDAKIMEIIEGSAEVQQMMIASEAYRGRAE